MTMTVARLQQIVELVHREIRGLQDPVEDLGLERAPWMTRDDRLLPWTVWMSQREVAAHLVVSIPAGSAERPYEVIPGEVPGEFAHTGTSTVASAMVVSSGSGSPCRSALST